MISMVIGLMFSPPVVNLAELLLLITIVFSKELRGRVAAACRQPIVLWVLAFYVAVSAGVLYSMAPSHDAASMWGGWRKMLLLPLAIALFDEVAWKKRLIEALVVVATVSAIASYIGLLAHFTFPVAGGAELGVLVRNHATQGMIFSVAAFTALSIAFSDKELGALKRWALILSAILLIGNVIVVTTSRSGYIVTIVCVLSGLIGLFHQ